MKYNLIEKEVLINVKDKYYISTIDGHVYYVNDSKITEDKPAEYSYIGTLEDCENYLNNLIFNEKLEEIIDEA